MAFLGLATVKRGSEILQNIELLADDLEMRGTLNSPSFKVAELAVGGRR